LIFGFSRFSGLARNFSDWRSGRFNSDGFYSQLLKNVSKNWRKIDIKDKIMIVITNVDWQNINGISFLSFFQYNLY